MQSSKPAIIILIIIILCTVILIIFFKKAEYSRLFIHIYKETENNLLKENFDIYIWAVQITSRNISIYKCQKH